MAPQACQEKLNQRMLHFKLFVVWKLEEHYASVKKHLITFPWTRNLQISQLYEAISKMYPFWKRDEFRLYGRCGDVYMPIKNYITLTATLRHMASYATDLLYLVRTDIIEEKLLTVEELKKRWHVREAEQEEADVKIIQKWFGDQGYEGRIPEIRGEHAPAEKASYADSDQPTSSKGSTTVKSSHHKK